MHLIHKIRNFGFWIVLVAFFVLIIGSVFYKNTIIEQLNLWRVLPQPETFTELYFDNHQKLPSIIKDDKDYSFSFITHNLEHKTVTYNYEVTISSESATLLNKGTFTLKHDQTKRIREELPLYVSIPKSKIEVNLFNKNQKIHFWVIGLYQDNGKSNGNNTMSQ